MMNRGILNPISYRPQTPFWRSPFYTEYNFREYQSLVNEIWSVWILDSWNHSSFRDSSCYMWSRTAVDFWKGSNRMRVIDIDSWIDTGFDLDTIMPGTDFRVWYLADNQILTPTWVYDLNGEKVYGFWTDAEAIVGGYGHIIHFKDVCVWDENEIRAHWILEDPQWVFDYCILKSNMEQYTSGWQKYLKFDYIWKTPYTAVGWWQPGLIMYGHLWAYLITWCSPNAGSWYNGSSCTYINPTTYEFTWITDDNSWYPHPGLIHAQNYWWWVWPNWNIFRAAPRDSYDGHRYWWQWIIEEISTIHEWFHGVGWYSIHIRPTFFIKFLWNFLDYQYWYNTLWYYFVDTDWTVSNATWLWNIYSVWTWNTTCWFVDENWYIYPAQATQILKTDKEFTDFNRKNPYLRR